MLPELEDFPKITALKIAKEMGITEVAVIKIYNYCDCIAGFVCDINPEYYKPVTFFSIEKGEVYSSDRLDLQPRMARNLIKGMLDRTKLPKELAGLQLCLVPRGNGMGYGDFFIPREVK